MDIVNNFVLACGKDEFPDDDITLHTFMFDRVHSIEEAENLLGLYIGIVKCMPYFQKDAMAAAVQENKLTQYILAMYDRYGQDSYYSKWFRQTVGRFS